MHSNTKSFKAWQARKAERMGGVGLEFENEVHRILDKMQDERLIVSFVRFDRISEEYRNGKDFSVGITSSEGKDVFCAFGVTISLRSWEKAKIRHPLVPQLCFPLGTKLETIRKRILGLPYK